ncbi:MAG: hypothetical protein ACU0BF_02685 [Paracoccaceae bacterium]
MAERARSKDGTRETEQYTGETATPGQQGRAGGELEREVGTQDELKRARDDRAGTTRVTKADEKGQGNLGRHHGMGVDR